jgi:hypothetical protein
MHKVKNFKIFDAHRGMPNKYIGKQHLGNLVCNICERCLAKFVSALALLLRSSCSLACEAFKLPLADETCVQIHLYRKFIAMYNLINTQ